VQLNRDPLGGGSEIGMNWDALGAIGEIIGACAVVITLIYVAVQMRQNNRQIAENTKVVRLSARGATQEAFSRYRHLIADSPALAELYVRGCADYRALPVAERVRFGSLLSEYLLAWNLRYLHIRDGLQDPDTWERQKAFLVSVLTQPGVRYWWDRNQHMFDSAFVAAVESMAASASRNEPSAAQQGAAAAEPQRVPIDL
jgi:hypothetical protein